MSYPIVCKYNNDTVFNISNPRTIHVVTFSCIPEDLKGCVTIYVCASMALSVFTRQRTAHPETSSVVFSLCHTTFLFLVPAGHIAEDRVEDWVVDQGIYFKSHSTLGLLELQKNMAHLIVIPSDYSWEINSYCTWHTFFCCCLYEHLVYLKISLGMNSRMINLFYIMNL